MTRPKLSIAIPTFRRRAALDVTLRTLAAQIGTQNIPVVVVNNDAETPFQPAELPLIGRRPVEVFNNRYNVGGNANILRCLEYAESDYVWLLSDDDDLATDAICIILADIAKGNPVHLSYGLPSSLRPVSVVATGVEAYIDSLVRLNDLWLISNWVFSVDALRDAMRGACNMLTSCAPHIVLALEMLRRPDATAVLSHRAIITGNMQHGADGGWSILNFCLRRGTLLTLDIPGPQRRHLRAKMIAMMPFLDHCALALALRAIRTGDERDACEQYRFIYETNVRGSGTFALWARYRILSILLRFPHTVRALAVRKKGREFIAKLEAFDHDART